MIFTSESVTAGHPDKLCDQISDAAVDALLRRDDGARAVVECAVATGIVFLAARYTGSAAVDLPSLARAVIGEAGYLSGRFEAKSCSVLTSLTELPEHQRESPAAGGDEDFDRYPAREHVNVFGYACHETPELMPLPISLAHRLARALDAARRSRMHWLSPDAKVQVSVEYRDTRPVRVHGVAVSASIGSPRPPTATAEESLRDVVHGVLNECEMIGEPRPQLHFNFGEDHDGGGPASHAGLTGRKTGIDTYGDMARQSGAALSGKDPSRIDRIGAYAARHAAKAVVAAAMAERCEVHLAYAIGQVRPLSISIQTFGTGRIADEAMASRLAAVMDFRPAAIEARFGLRTRPGLAGDAGFYRRLAVYGHFGRTDLELPWEATGDGEALRG